MLFFARANWCSYASGASFNSLTTGQIVSSFKKISITSPFTSKVNGPARQVSGLMLWIEHRFPLQKMQVPSSRVLTA